MNGAVPDSGGFTDTWQAHLYYGARLGAFMIESDIKAGKATEDDIETLKNLKDYIRDVPDLIV